MAAYGVYLVLVLGAQAFRNAVIPELTRAAAEGRLGAETRAYGAALTLPAIVLSAVTISLAGPLGDAITGTLPEPAPSLASDALRWLVPAACAQVLAARGERALAARRLRRRGARLTARRGRRPGTLRPRRRHGSSPWRGDALNGAITSACRRRPQRPAAPSRDRTRLGSACGCLPAGSCSRSLRVLYLICLFSPHIEVVPSRPSRMRSCSPLVAAQRNCPYARHPALTRAGWTPPPPRLVVRMCLSADAALRCLRSRAGIVSALGGCMRCCFGADPAAHRKARAVNGRHIAQTLTFARVCRRPVCPPLWPRLRSPSRSRSVCAGSAASRASPSRSRSRRSPSPSC